MRVDREALTLSLLLALTGGVKGRYALSRELGVGEGVLRGLYRALREEGLIEVGRGGAWLTERGREAMQRMLAARGLKGVVVLEDVDAWGRRLRGVAGALEGRVGSVVEARDEAVRAGARMALIVENAGGRLVLPLVEECDLGAEAPQIHRALLSLPEARTYIVVLGEQLYPCVRGLLAAASRVKA